MGELIIFRRMKPLREEKLRVDFKKHKFSVQVNGYKFVDKDTKQHVVYMPSFDLSGYGETLEKAEEILKFNLQELFNFFSTLTPTKLQIELHKLGWKRGIFNKEYSKAYVDIDGQLKNLNAEDGKVEKIALTTA